MLAKLKRAFDALRSRDVSMMGYEAQIEHRRRVEHVQRRYEQALEQARGVDVMPSEHVGTSPNLADAEEKIPVGSA
jgi:hypothetical protein